LHSGKEQFNNVDNFCQETKVDKTTSFLKSKANAFKKLMVLVYLGPMEKFRKNQKN